MHFAMAEGLSSQGQRVWGSCLCLQQEPMASSLHRVPLLDDGNPGPQESEFRPTAPGPSGMRIRYTPVPGIHRYRGERSSAWKPKRS